MISAFCILWVPVFFLFWASLVPYRFDASSVWAVILGSFVGVMQFFLPPVINAGAFGFARWLHIFAEMVAGPVLVPLLLYALLLFVRLVKPRDGFAGFSLLWLTPYALMRAASWSGDNDPLRLVLIPLLWTAIAAVASELIDLAARKNPVIAIAAILGAIAISPVASTVYWAFFCHKTVLGCSLLAITLIPLIAAAGKHFLTRPDAPLVLPS